MVGKALDVGEGVRPYIGFGYRYLNDDTSDSPGGYERESNYYYIPVGIELKSKERPITLTLEFDYLIEGRQKSHLGDAVPGWPTVENKQDDGYGLRAVIRYVDKDGRFFCEGFYRYWNIEDSDIEFGGLEPANKTSEVGFLIGIPL